MTRTVRIGWLSAGIAAAAFLVFTQAEATGGWFGLLQVGEASPMRQLVESELGQVPLAAGNGHDGQISFVIAADPWSIPSLDDETGYRYRRILYPALASLGGLLNGHAVLVGLIVTAVVSFGVAVMALAGIATHMGLSRWATAAVLANPGAWLSVRLLTPDSLSLALGLSGILLFLSKRHTAALLALAGAALAKDQAILVAVGIALWWAIQRDWRLSARYLLIPPIPLAAWSASIALRDVPGFSPRGNLSLPFQGILDSMQLWADVPRSDAVLAVLTLATVVAALPLAFRFRDSWLGWQLGLWAILGIVVSSWVWDFGNNVARALGHLTAMVAIALFALARPPSHLTPSHHG